MMNELADHKRRFKRNGKAVRSSKQSALYYTTDCGGDENEDFDQNLHKRSISLTALHTSAGSPQQFPPMEQRMVHLDALEAKMANIEVSLSGSPRRKKGSSHSAGIISPTSHRNRDYYKELDSLRLALQDKENVIQTLKGQLCNNLSSRLALRNGAPPLTEADRKATEERLQRLRRDADNKKLAIKNLKHALERLDITDNIDVRIQQAELEYRLGREELELLTLREESRALQTALELAETHEKQKNDTIFSCITGSTQITIHAIEVSADPKSPRFGAGPREDVAGLYVDWAVEDSGLCKGDRILEVNGKLVVGAGRSDLARLLAVAPDAAQIVVLRRNESLAALRTLRSDNLRLTHRISYLEEQVRDLLAPRTELAASPLTESPANRQEHVQIFQKGPQVTLVSNVPGLSLKAATTAAAPTLDSRQSLPNIVKSSPRQQNQHHGHHPQLLDYSSTEALVSHHQSRSSRSSGGAGSGSSRHGKLQQHHQLHMAKSTASLDHLLQQHQQQQQQLQQQQQHYPIHQSSMIVGSPRRRATRIEEQMQHKNRKQQQLLQQQQQQQSLDFDSEPTYYRMHQDSQSRGTPEHSDASAVTSHGNSNQDYAVVNGIVTGSKSRPAPPKKPLRLSLHRATSLQSVESAPPSTSASSYHQDGGGYAPSKKPTKRNYRGDPPTTSSSNNGGDKSINGLRDDGDGAQHHQQLDSSSTSSLSAPQPPPRTPSRAESCQSALRWPSPKPKPHLAQLSLEKWC